MKLPGLKDYARLIIKFGGATPFVNQTDLSNAFIN